MLQHQQTHLHRNLQLIIFLHTRLGIIHIETNREVGTYLRRIYAVGEGRAIFSWTGCKVFLSVLGSTIRYRYHAPDRELTCFLTQFISKRIISTNLCKLLTKHYSTRTFFSGYAFEAPFNEGGSLFYQCFAALKLCKFFTNEYKFQITIGL